MNVSTLMRVVRGNYDIGRVLALAAAVSAIMLAAAAGQPAAQQPTAQQPATQQPAPPPATPPRSAPAPTAPQQRTPPRAAQDEFVPVSDLPDSEKLPAAPFLIAAYTIAWLVLLGYVWSLWRRLTHVEQELKQAVSHETRHA